MDDNWRIYDSILLPHIFLGSPGTCACNMYQALLLLLPEGSGYEAREGLIWYTRLVYSADAHTNIVGMMM